MLRVSSLQERSVAVLHDVVEDTNVSLQDLIAEGFSPDIISAVEAITRW
jgi:(p)ppGpp synthase/HD superfamily hydrolase